MENNTFVYQYSSKRNQEVESIRQRYLPREITKTERLKALDRQAQAAGMMESLSLGVLGSLVFGVGMCFGLDVFGGADWLTVLFGILGVLIMLPAYPLYRSISKKARARLTPEIIRLSDEILKS